MKLKGKGLKVTVKSKDHTKPEVSATPLTSDEYTKQIQGLVDRYLESVKGKKSIMVPFTVGVTIEHPKAPVQITDVGMKMLRDLYESHTHFGHWTPSNGTTLYCDGKPMGVVDFQNPITCGVVGGVLNQ